MTSLYKPLRFSPLSTNPHISLCTVCLVSSYLFLTLLNFYALILHFSGKTSIKVSRRIPFARFVLMLVHRQRIFERRWVQIVRKPTSENGRSVWFAIIECSKSKFSPGDFERVYSEAPGLCEDVQSTTRKRGEMWTRGMFSPSHRFLSIKLYVRIFGLCIRSSFLCRTQTPSLTKIWPEYTWRKYLQMIDGDICLGTIWEVGQPPPSTFPKCVHL